MSDTKCQSDLSFFFFFLPPGQRVVLKETNHRENVEVTTVGASVSRGDDNCKAEEDSTTKYAEVLCACVCSCDSMVTHGDAIPLEETENCHNVHLKHSLSPSLPLWLSAFQQGSQND